MSEVVIMSWFSSSTLHIFKPSIVVYREEQDKFAVESHKKAAAAAAAGKFKEEIVPITTTIIDPQTKESKPITVSADDGIRANSSLQSLARLPAAFKKDGSTTAGNSSQVSCYLVLQPAT
jgi:acetyl-CoA acyltransferase 1